MSETKKPDIIKAVVEWRGLTVQVNHEVDAGPEGLVLVITTPDDSIRLEGMHANWLKYNLYRLFQSIE